MNVTNIVAVALASVVSVLMIYGIIKSIYRLRSKLRAEEELERELSLLVENSEEVRDILLELDAEIADKNIRDETYLRARKVVSEAARKLKKNERIAVLEGVDASIPYVSKILKKSLGAAV